MQSIFIGSQLWVTKGESRQEMLDDVRGMLGQGLTLARVFITWADVRTNDTWDFSLWDQFFSVCEQEGLRITATLSSLANTGEVAFGQTATPDTWAQNKARILSYIKAVVLRYRTSTALDSWILQNEPNLAIAPDALTVPLFRDYLREKYPADAFAARYHLHDPAQVGWIAPDGSRARVQGIGEPGWNYEVRVDWTHFNRHLLLGRLKEAQQLVHALDGAHPTSVNADNLSSASPTHGGRDVFGMGKIVDFMGCSSHVSWHSTRFPSRKIHQSVAMFADITRAATRDANGCFWMTELQAGANYFSGVRPMCPSAKDIEHWLWEAIGTGARGVVYWLYKARPAGFEALEWGLMNQLGEPSCRSEASKGVSDFLQAHAAVLDHSRPKAYDGLILFSNDSSILAHHESNNGQARSADIQLPRNDLMVQDARCGAYLLMQDMGLDVGFVAQEDLSGLATDTPFVLAPNTYALQPAAVQALGDYVRGGGTLVVDGLFAAKDADGNRSNRAVQRALGELFGSPVADFRVDEHPIEFTDERGAPLAGWFLTCQWTHLPQDARILLKDASGKACGVERRLGKGRAIYIGTLLFQNYFRTGGDVPSYRAWLKDALNPANAPYQLLNPSPFLRRKVLKAPDGDVIVVMNRAGAAEALLATDCALTDLATGERFAAAQGQASIPIAADQVRILQSM